MKDTPKHIDIMMRTMMMECSGEERMKMGCQMYDAAKTMARASLKHLPEPEARVELFKRFYGADFDEQTRNQIISKILHVSTDS